MKNPHIGPTLKEGIDELRKRDPEFSVLYGEEKAREKLGVILKIIREDLGITQQQAARMAGVSQALVGRLESKSSVEGGRKPNMILGKYGDVNKCRLSV